MTVTERINNRKIGIVGMARSGLAAATLAAKLGGQPFVSDSADAAVLSSQVEFLKANDIRFEVGGHTEELLNCDYLVLSPGVPPTVDILAKAARQGIPMFAEIEFAGWVCRGRIAAITGSNGKTTTTTLLGEMLQAGGYEVEVCGNIGRPFAEIALTLSDKGLAVVEVSTFQLETIDEFHPHIAAILNLSPDHLDRHGDFETYKKMKYRIAENQTANDFLILNQDDSTLMSDQIATDASPLRFSIQSGVESGAVVRGGRLFGVYGGQETEIIETDHIRIPGRHNLQNAAAAVSAAMAFGVDAKTLAKVLKSFPGVEHRLEPAGSVAGVSFVNDSKATNVDSVCWALKSIPGPIFLIAGGRGKGASYAPLIEAGRGKVGGVVAIGEEREQLFDALGRAFPVQFADSLEEAVLKAFEAAEPGATVLLSPACASFDMFENFEVRGRAFKNAVVGLKDGTKNKLKTNG
jgi:UDP-N-acetylmuramoylalanine--D-glutamate ligase